MDLLERDSELRAVTVVLAEAAGGQGSGVAVTGDAGAGKSALLGAACAARTDLRVLWGSCDPLRTPRPLGPFRDIAREAGLSPLLRADEGSLAQACDVLYELLTAEPTALVVEDLHWIDEASVDVLRFLVRRIDAMPLALLLSYRDAEIAADHSARTLLGDFARLEDLTTLQLAPLSVEAVQTLVLGTELDPSRVHRLTGGNPFFVTEVANQPDRPLPTSVRDAVLARTAELAPADLEVLQLVATAPDRLDDRLLPALGVDLPTLRRLSAVDLLTRARGGLVFRHELARQAVESSIPLAGEQRLHERVLDALERLEPQDPAVLTHHAVAAGDTERVARYSQAAAREAIAAGAHSEAAAFFTTALDHLQHAAPGERADLLQRLSFEQYMTSHLAEAIENIRASFPLWQRAGDLSGLARAHERCAVYEYYNARRNAAVSYVDRATSIASESGATLAYGMARATRGFMAYMRNEPELALDCIDEAARIAAAYEAPGLTLRTETVQTLVVLAAGDGTARGRLADQIEAARIHGLDELASTGYSQLASIDVEYRRFRAAEHVLEESLPFAIERDIPICQHWQIGVRSRLHFSQGRWSAALEDAERVLDEEGMPLATVWPHLVAGLVPRRRGEGGAGQLDHLEAAWGLAGQIDEPLRRFPVLSALAEAMWLSGSDDPRVTQTAVAEVSRLDGVSGLEWARGDLAVWLARLDLPTAEPEGVAEPYRLALAGLAVEAAAWWERAGDPFAQALALVDAVDPADRTRGVQLLDQLGAVGAADRVRSALRRDGIAAIPPRPRLATRANPAGLTNRQLEVAKLVARGFTNAEIANRLYISAKTADHHVSAVLTKLGLANRRAVVVRAEELGLA